MVTTHYTAYDTYLIYAEDLAYGTAGTPSGSSTISKVQSFNANMSNNILLHQGIGDGLNAQSWSNGVFNVNGSMNMEVSDLTFLQYGFGSEISGAGTLADPYEFQEISRIGYSAGYMPTLTLEVGGNGGGGTDDVLTVDGVVITDMTLGLTQGSPVTASMNWGGRQVVASTIKETYVPGTTPVLTFVEGAVTIGTDTVLELMSGEIRVMLNPITYACIGSRFIQQPQLGVRRYEFTLNVKLTADDGASETSYQDLRAKFFNGSTGTEPGDSARFDSLGTISLDLIEGSSNGDRVINLDFQNTQFQTISEPVDMGNGVREATITGFALSGLADSTVYVPLRYYTIVA